MLRSCGFRLRQCDFRAFPRFALLRLFGVLLAASALVLFPYSILTLSEMQEAA